MILKMENGDGEDDKVKTIEMIRGKRCCSLIAGDKVYLYPKSMASAMI